MRSWRPFCCGWPGLMRSIAMPSRSHQTESLERLNKALGLAKGTPLSERMASGRPRSRNSRSKAVQARSSRVEFERFAQQQEARGMVGDGQRIAVAPIAELELALEVGAPQLIGRSAFGQRRAARAVARPAAALDQAVAVENRMDGAFGRNPDVAVEPPDQELADLARTPVRLLGLEPDDQALDLLRQLVGIAHRPPRAIAQGLPARAPCSDRKSCSRSCGRCRTPGTRPSWPPHPAGGRQSAGVLPSPNSLSTASTPPAEQRRKV